MTALEVQVAARVKSSLGALERVVLLSPSSALREIFPTALELTNQEWDLSRPKPELRCDLLVACTLSAVRNSPEWRLENALGSCRALLVICEPEALTALGERMLARFPISTEHQRALGTQAGALIKGDLDGPLLRVDDYPTGVRPIARDLSALHDVLGLFDAHDVEYRLGIVPAITTSDMFGVLRSFRRMRVAQHGFNHQYPKYSALLERRGDPDNQRGTVGAFNEFAWQFPKTVLQKLKDGKSRLENELSTQVDVYIPPCNRCDRSTAKALDQLGFKLCLSERVAPGGFLPTLGSDFYGRSNGFDDVAIPEVISLHATWEADLWRAGERSALPRMLTRITEHTKAKRESVLELSRALGAQG